MLIILLFIILFHLTAIILLLVATIHNVSANQERTYKDTAILDHLLVLTASLSLSDAGLVGGVTRRT